MSYKRVAIFVFVLSIVCQPYGITQQVTNSQLDEFKSNAMSAFDEQRDEFNRSADALVAEYEEYRQKLMAEYEAHCQEVKSKWGDDKVVESEPKQWVEYSDDLSQRSVVDFESGEVKVEVLLDANQTGGGDVEQQLQRAVEQLMASRGKTTNYKSQYEPQRDVEDAPILGGLLDTQKYGVVATPVNSQGVTSGKTSSPPMPVVGNSATLPKQRATEDLPAEVSAPKPTVPQPIVTNTTVSASANLPAEPSKPVAKTISNAQPSQAKSTELKSEITTIRDVAKAIVKDTKYMISKRVDDKGVEKSVVTIKLELNKNHISEQAATYKSEIAKNAGRFEVEESLIYAIMEQESAFNPMAKSHIPAYGLMQLVPSSGGRDSYSYVYKKDIIPTSSYLYKWENNIELGTAYLRLLRMRYFSKVTNAKSQRLCMIASYNAGAGGLSRAINGTTNIFKAIPTINAMSYDDLYNKLRVTLPKETQDYIYKVTRNFDKYTSQK